MCSAVASLFATTSSRKATHMSIKKVKPTLKLKNLADADLKKVVGGKPSCHAAF